MSTPSEVAGRYRIDRRLGAGGMSTVFLAIDTVLERPVAVKLLAEHLADDEAFVMRFRHEALSAARLQHPNVVQVFDSGQDEASHRHFIVMEYVEGHSCAELLREHKRLEVDRAVASSSPKSNTWTMLGCTSRAAASASRRKRWTKPSSTARCSASSLTAT